MIPVLNKLQEIMPEAMKYYNASNKKTRSQVLTGTRATGTKT
jgi:hypothetical protein